MKNVSRIVFDLSESDLKSKAYSENTRMRTCVRTGIIFIYVCAPMNWFAASIPSVNTPGGGQPVGLSRHI